MNESVIVGGLAMVASLILAVLQIRSQAATTPEEAWIHTPARHHRRLAISLVLAALGALIFSTGIGWLPIEPAEDGTLRINNLIFFVVGGMVMAIILVALAFLDFRESTRLLARNAVFELGRDGLGDSEDPFSEFGPDAREENRPIPTTKSNARLPRAPDPDRD